MGEVEYVRCGAVEGAGTGACARRLLSGPEPILGWADCWPDVRGLVAFTGAAGGADGEAGEAGLDPVPRGPEALAGAGDP